MYTNLSEVTIYLNKKIFDGERRMIVDAKESQFTGDLSRLLTKHATEVNDTRTKRYRLATKIHDTDEKAYQR